MREVFERVAVNRKWFQELYGLRRLENEGYLDLYLQLRWEGWKAACLYKEEVLETL